MVKNLTLLLQGAQVRFLVGELRSHMLCSVAKKKKKPSHLYLLFPRTPKIHLASFLSSGLAILLLCFSCHPSFILISARLAPTDLHPIAPFPTLTVLQAGAFEGSRHREEIRVCEASRLNVLCFWRKNISVSSSLCYSSHPPKISRLSVHLLLCPAPITTSSSRKPLVKALGRDHRIPLGLLRWRSGKESAQCRRCDARDLGSIPGSGRSPGEGNGHLLQYSCLENSWTEKPGGLLSMSCKKYNTHTHTHTHTHTESL